MLSLKAQTHPWSIPIPDSITNQVKEALHNISFANQSLSIGMQSLVFAAANNSSGDAIGGIWGFVLADIDQYKASNNYELTRWAIKIDIGRTEGTVDITLIIVCDETRSTQQYTASAQYLNPSEDIADRDSLIGNFSSIAEVLESAFEALVDHWYRWIQPTPEEGDDDA